MRVFGAALGMMESHLSNFDVAGPVLLQRPRRQAAEVKILVRHGPRRLSELDMGPVLLERLRRR